MKPHAIDVRIYYEDTDAGNVVFYGNYMRFAERGRTELLRSMGFENTYLRDRYGVIFVVRHLEADYLRPARLDDLLKIETSVLEVKNASVVMNQSAYLNEQEIFKMRVTLVCVDVEKTRPSPIPEEAKTGFMRYLRETN